MANWHGYIGIENIALNNAQRGQLVSALRAIGRQSGSQPAHINHWRPRLDNDAAIFEALFDEDELTAANVKGYIAGVFGVDAGDISHAASNNQYGTSLTLTHGGTDYLRFQLFGGVGTTWEESRQEVISYLSANQAEWEPAEV